MRSGKPRSGDSAFSDAVPLSTRLLRGTLCVRQGWRLRAEQRLVKAALDRTVARYSEMVDKEFAIIRPRWMDMAVHDAASDLLTSSV